MIMALAQTERGNIQHLGRATKLIRHMFREPFYAGLAIFAISCAIRVAFVLHTPLELAMGEPRHIAIALLDHRGFSNPFQCSSGPTAHSNPFLPVLIAGVYSVFGTGGQGELARCLICAAVLSLCYALLPWIARRLDLPVAAGAIGGLICALFPFKRTSETVSFFDEPFVALALLLLSVYSYKLLKKAKLQWRDAVSYGLVWGIAFYVGAGLFPVFIATLLMLLAAPNTQAKPARAIQLGASLVVALLVTVPWTLRNYHELHTIAFMRDNLGLELFVANSDGAGPSLKENLRTGHHNIVHPLLNPVECATVGRLGEGEYNRTKLNAATRWIEEHPLSFGKLTVERGFYFWAGDPLDYSTAVANSLLSIAGLAGFILLVRRRPYTSAVLACCFLFYPLIHYLIQTTPRYTIPLHPLVALCAGYSIYLFWKARQTRNHIQV